MDYDCHEDKESIITREGFLPITKGGSEDGCIEGGCWDAHVEGFGSI